MTFQELLNQNQALINFCECIVYHGSMKLVHQCLVLRIEAPLYGVIMLHNSYYKDNLSYSSFVPFEII